MVWGRGEGGRGGLRGGLAQDNGEDLFGEGIFKERVSLSEGPVALAVPRSSELETSTMEAVRADFAAYGLIAAEDGLDGAGFVGRL